MTETKTRRERVPIVIPGAEHMTPEELKKAKHNEKMRRYMARKRGAEEVTPVKQTAQEIMVLKNEELIALSSESRDLVVMAINAKMKQILTNPESLEKINLVSLTTAFGTLVDKVNLMNGLATENIAVHHKVDINMTADEAMQQLAKIRESYAESNG